MLNLGSAYGEIQIGTDQAQKSVQGLAAQMAGVGKTLSLAVSAPLLGVAGAALNSAGDFEQAMNQIEVVGGVTGGALQALQAQALQLGAETSFSAGEAADAMLELAKAGLNAEQTMQAVPGVLDLAAAGGVGLADAAALTANALNAFHLGADQSAYVANLLAAAANASSANISDLSDGLKQGAFAFAASGQNVDDLVASLAILTNVGLTGSDAGTALKNAFTRLMSPTKQARELMDELGISFFDAQGDMLPMRDIIGILNNSLGGMTQQQKLSTLETLFLSDGMKAMIPLLDQGVGGFDAMKESVNQEGAAASVANARMKGFAGAIEYIKGSIDSFLIETALPFLDNLSGIIHVVADAISAFSGLPEPVRNAALAFAGVLAAAGPIMLALSGVGAVLGALLSPIGLVVLAMAGLAAAWTADFMGLRTQTLAAWTAIQPTLQQIWSWLAVTLPAGLTILQGWFTSVWNAIPSAVSSASATMTGVFAAIQIAWGQAVAFFGPSLARLGASLGEFFAELGTLGDEVAALWQALQPVVSGVLAGLMRSMQVALGVISVLWVTAVNFLAATFANLAPLLGVAVDQISAFLNLITGVVSNVAALVTAVINGDWAAAWTAAQNIVDGLFTYMQTTLGNLLLTVATIFTIIGTTISSTLADLGFAGAAAAVQTVIDKITALLDWLGKLVAGDVTLNLTAPGWVATLVDWAWPDFIGQPGWVATLFDWLWPDFIGQPAWAKALVAWAWPLFISQPDWAKVLVAWAWPLFIGQPGWVASLMDWLWPDFDMPDWLNRLFDWSWPSLPSLPGWLGGNAGGTSYYTGGRTLLNERGRELIALPVEQSVLPAGSQVFTNGQSNRLLAGAGGTGGDIHIHLDGLVINNEQDVAALGWRLGNYARRAAGR